MQQQTMEREDDMFSTTATTGLKAMYERVTGGKRRQNAAANVPLLGERYRFVEGFVERKVRSDNQSTETFHCSICLENGIFNISHWY
eukprot:m.207865 g.207865  ORF g.207865 m.207865 type:complete len:87 (+) comp13762_c0_seq76:1-261(+)